MIKNVKQIQNENETSAKFNNFITKIYINWKLFYLNFSIEVGLTLF